MCIAAAIGYSVYAFRERYLCRKKNEELRDRYKLLKESIENEPDKNRARYRVAHEQEKIDAVKKRLKEKYGEKILTERKLLEEILDIEKEKAEEMAVDFSAEIHNSAEDLLIRFSQDEMISFFLNLLDNAIEAAGGSGKGDRAVSFVAGETIRITNSKEESRMPEGKTSKEDADRHGFGLRVIENICKEKNLSIDYLNRGGFLETEIKKQK
jgi:signal transduction histidine kinase